MHYDPVFIVELFTPMPILEKRPEDVKSHTEVSEDESGDDVSSISGDDTVDDDDGPPDDNDNKIFM